MIALAFALTQAYVHEPFENYSKEMHSGFTLYISAAARKQNDTTQPAINLLAKQLKEMVEIVPAESLKTLRAIPVFMEQENPKHPCACYHVSKEWLAENGYIPQKVRSVEISNTKNYVGWINLNQPFMTLHEFAHGYHDALYTHNDKYIEAVYKSAVSNGKYDLVPHNRGGKRKAYALNNQAEYFAELTEAYFGINDFYPFKRAELKEFDPQGYDMIERCWKIKKQRSSTSQ